jgi:hypothetical protein
MESVDVQCPYCGEWFEALVDTSAGDQAYIEDCEICCRPIQFHVRARDGELLGIEVRRDDE